MNPQVRRAKTDDAYGIARVHVDSWRTTYKGLISAEYLQSLSYEVREKEWNAWLSNQDTRTKVNVALDEEGSVVGFSSSGPERSADQQYSGELYAIYILERSQRKGLSRELMVSAARDLALAGFPSMLTWVLISNPSRRFYEAMGGAYLRLRDIRIGESAHREAAYGWRDIRILAGP